MHQVCKDRSLNHSYKNKLSLKLNATEEEI